MSKSNKPISVLEESFLSFKKYLETNINHKEAVITASFIEDLRRETTQILEICNVLNQDVSFIQNINQDANSSKTSDGLFHKTESFFLSDIIALYEQELATENKKSQFVLAYYYDVLKNKHFADVNTLEALNQLISSSEFKNHLQKIKKDNLILPADGMQKRYFLSEALFKIKHIKENEISVKYQNFIKYAFEKKFNNTKEFNVFFSLNSNLKSEKNEQKKLNLEEDTLEKVLQELNFLTGLDEVKKDVTALVNLLEIQKKRTQEGLKNVEITLHTVFLGPPGTGKTSVARLLSRIFKHLGLLKKDKCMKQTEKD